MKTVDGSALGTASHRHNTAIEVVMILFADHDHTLLTGSNWTARQRGGKEGSSLHCLQGRETVNILH